MRRYILTERERNITKNYLEKGIKLKGFSQLDKIIEESRERLNEDVELLNKFISKA